MNMWSQGIVDGRYKYEMNYDDEPSEYGIDGGRISKLTIRDMVEGCEVMNYDRGWDIEPVTEDAGAILAFLLWMYR